MRAEALRPCPTYRPAERGLAPERQLAFVFRTERTRTAYAFPPAAVEPGAAIARKLDSGGRGGNRVDSRMRLTVLGKSPSWQDANGACSGYLLEEGGSSVLVDCGNGVFSKLRRYRDYTQVDAVLVSHLHADHFLDLVPFSYALTYAPRQQPVPVDRWPGTDDPARPRLIAPPGAAATFRHVVGAWGNEDLIENAFAIEEYDEESRPEVGPLRFAFRIVPALPRDVRDLAWSRRTAAGGSSSAPTAARPTTSWTSHATPSCCWPRPRCRGPSAPGSGVTSRRERPASTPARPVRAACS